MQKIKKLKKIRPKVKINIWIIRPITRKHSAVVIASWRVIKEMETSDFLFFIYAKESRA